MRILVTGAAGFLGRNWCERLVTEGHTVWGVDDESSPYAKWWDWPSDYDGRAKYVKYVGTVHEFLGTFLTEGPWDRVYHFAAPVGGREKIEGNPFFNAQSLNIDVELFRWLVGLDKKPLLVYPSSSAVYPVALQNGREPQRLRECDQDLGLYSDTWGVPDEMYGFTKLAGEYLATKAAKFGLNTLLMRPFSGYGEGQSQEYPFPSIMRRIARRDDPLVIWGTGTQVRDFIYVGDIIDYVEAYLSVQRIQGTKAINLGSGVGTSFLELAEMGIVEEGYTPEIHTVPSKPTGVQYRVSQWGLPALTPLEEGVRRMLEYERKQLDG